MDYIEISGKTVDDALTEALVKLETTSDKVKLPLMNQLRKYGRIRLRLQRMAHCMAGAATLSDR